MWPFFSKIPNIERISEDADEITIIHDKGALKVQKSEILDFKLESDHFSGRLTDDQPFFYSLRGIILGFIFFGGVMNLMTDSVYDSKNVKVLHFYFSSYAWCTSVISGVIFYFISTYVIKLFDLNTGLKSYKKDIWVIKLNQSLIKLRGKNFNIKHYQFIKNIFEDEQDSKPNFFTDIKVNSAIWTYIILTLLSFYYLFQFKVPTFQYLTLKAVFVGSGDYSEIQTYFDIYHEKYLWLFIHGALSTFITPFIIVAVGFVVGVMFMLTISLTISWLFWPVILFFDNLNYKRINEQLWKSYLIWGIIFIAALILNHYVYQNIIFTLVVSLVTVIILFISLSTKIRKRFNLASYLYSYKIGIWVCLLFYSPMIRITFIDAGNFHKFNIETTRLFALLTLFLAIVAPILIVIKSIRWVSFDDWIQKKSNPSYWNKLLMPYPSVVIRWVGKDGLILEKLPQHYKGMYAIVSEAMNQNITSFQFAPEEMKKDRDFIQEKIIYFEKRNSWNGDNNYSYHIEYLKQLLYNRKS